jgi:hypothetical protein
MLDVVVKLKTGRQTLPTPLPPPASGGGIFIFYYYPGRRLLSQAYPGLSYFAPTGRWSQPRAVAIMDFILASSRNTPLKQGVNVVNLFLRDFDFG